eukprot:scaffold32920_cov129-Isochrysis_galbana.AAC.3
MSTLERRLHRLSRMPQHRQMALARRHLWSPACRISARTPSRPRMSSAPGAHRCRHGRSDDPGPGIGAHRVPLPAHASQSSHMHFITDKRQLTTRI